MKLSKHGPVVFFMTHCDIVTSSFLPLLLNRKITLDNRLSKAGKAVSCQMNQK